MILILRQNPNISFEAEVKFSEFGATVDNFDVERIVSLF